MTAETAPRKAPEQLPRPLVGDERERPEPLLPRVAAGEPGAAGAVLDAYGGLIWTIARRMLGHGPDTEDAVQEIFIELWRSADRFDPAKGTEVTFVGTIARRRVVDWVRRRQRQPGMQPLPDEPMETSAETAEGPAAVADEFARARAAMAQLPQQRREVLQLAVMSGVSHSQIAEQTGLPLGTVKTHVRRGLIRLRALLADDDGESAS